MNRKTPAGLHPQIHVIAFNETNVCEFGDNTPHIKSVETIRFYDNTEATYLCEITPSYALYYIDTRVTMQEHCYNEHGDLLPEFERLRDDLESDLRRWEEEVTYMHCYSVDALAAKLKDTERFRYYQFEPEQKTRRWIEKHLDNGYDGFLDSMREYMQGNAVV